LADDLSVRTVLGTYVAKFLAAAIVVLALVPFTAPFSTFDAVEIVAEQVVHVNAPQTKAVQDLTDALCLPTTACALTLDDTVQAVGLADSTDVRPFRVLVLRI
jgi:hypothetical protein